MRIRRRLISLFLAVVLKEADVANVVIASTPVGAVYLMPALAIKTDMTVAAFDATHPNGADIIIVPPLHDSSSTSI